MTFHTLDASATNLLAFYPKVQSVLRGEVPIPEVAEFFITNYCSFRCPHCRCAGAHEGSKAYIDLDLMREVLDDLVEMGVYTIELGGGGEPLEHPQIIEVFRLLAERNMRCGLITNGYALVGNGELQVAIAEVADWIRISLDAVTDESYRIIHGRTDLSYGILRETLKGFVEQAASSTSDEKRTRLGIKLIIQKHNFDTAVHSFDEASYIGADYLQFKWLENHPFTISEAARPGIINELSECVSRSSIPVDMLSGYGGEVPSEQAGQRCVMSILHPLIDWDGSLYVCAFFQHRKEGHCIGKLSDKPFSELWGSPDHKVVMDSVDPKLCVPNCPLKRYNPIVEFIKQEAYRFHYI